MKLLLDTHVFIWWNAEPNKLSTRALALIQDRANTLILSVASVWEIQIKLQTNKLTSKTPIPTILKANQDRNRLQILPIMLDHIFALEQLPLHHKDPFDRLLIAQAMAENASLISHDPLMSQYPIQVIW